MLDQNDLTPEQKAEVKKNTEEAIEAKTLGKEKETPTKPTGEETPKAPEAEKPTEEKSKEFQSMEAQKKHFQEKADKLQKELEEIKPKPAETPEEKGTEKAEIWEMSNDPMEVVELGKVLQDYSKDETEFIMKNAPTKNLEGIIKATENPMVQAAIQGMREKAEKESKTPSPSSPTPGEPEVSTVEVVSKGPEEVVELAKKRYEELEKKGIKSEI